MIVLVEICRVSSFHSYCLKEIAINPKCIVRMEDNEYFNKQFKDTPSLFPKDLHPDIKFTDIYILEAKEPITVLSSVQIICSKISNSRILND